MSPLTVEQEQHKDMKSDQESFQQRADTHSQVKGKPTIRSGRVSVVARKATEGRVT
jgi:hypothetical protein